MVIKERIDEEIISVIFSKFFFSNYTINNYYLFYLIFLLNQS